MLKVSIKTANAAFGDGNMGHECARILRELANALEVGEGGSGGRLSDFNGNTVGEWKLTHRRED